MEKSRLPDFHEFELSFIKILVRILGAVHEDVCTFIACFRQKHFMFNNPRAPPPKNRSFYELMWKNMAEPDRPQMTVWRMRIACRIPEATDAHSEYVIQSECLLPRTGTQVYVVVFG